MSEEDRKTLLVMLVDVAKAIQNSQAYPQDPHDNTDNQVSERIREIIHNHPAWQSVVSSGFTVRDVFNAFYKN